MNDQNKQSAATLADPADQAECDAASVAESFTHCHQVTRQRARNFYYGMKLTPEPKRSAMYALYTWMRQADDLADQPGPTDQKIQRIEAFRHETHARLAGSPVLGNGTDEDEKTGTQPFWPAFTDTISRYRIPMNYLDAMIDGQIVDQHKARYATFDELYDYCYKVASVVGLCCIEIWGYEGGEQTRQLSEWRGIAFQLTNILRDLREDAQRDRVYLPAELCQLHELNPAMFTVKIQPELLKGAKELADRAASFYSRSAELDERVHRDGRPCLQAMTQIYQGLLEKIRAAPERAVEGQRVRLSAWRKGLIALRARWAAGANR